MIDFLDANNRIETIASNAAVLLAGITVLLSFACLAVAAHRSPVHRQRLAEFAIAATLIWALLAVTPLPRPLARGFFAELSSATARQASALQVSPPQAPAATSVAGPPEANSGGGTQAISADSAHATGGVSVDPTVVRLVPRLLPLAGSEGFAVDTKNLKEQLKPDCPRPRCPEAAAPIRVSPDDLVVDSDPDESEIVPDQTSTKRLETVTVEQLVTLDPSGALATPTSVENSTAIESSSEQTAATSSVTSVFGRVGSFLAARWKLLLLGAYGLGVVVCAAWIGLGRVLLALIVRTSRPPEEWLDELFADLCDERGTYRVWLLVAPRYPRAMSFGIFRPTIVLPAAQCVPENAEVLRHVLRHELVHIGRRDAWGTWLFNVSFLFLFFHPAFWWLRSRARLSAELVADEWAAARSSRDEYARELIAFVRATRRATILPAGATGVLGSTTPFSRRIEMLIRREQPLAMHSSPAWRIVSSGVLGGLIIAMAASLGRTAQDDPPNPDKTVTVHVDATNVTSDDSDKNKNDKVVIVREDDDRIKVLATDDDDDDAGEAQKHGDKALERMKKQYERLARKSAELQKQMAKLQQALEEAKAGGEHKSPSADSHESGEKVHVEKRVIIKDGKGHSHDGHAGGDAGVFRFEVDGKQFVIATPDGKGNDGKANFSINTKKKDGKDGEEATIELKTNEGEMILEIGPDHLPKMKKFKGFGKTPAEVEEMKKTFEMLPSLQKIEGLPPAEQLKELGKLKALEQLKDLGDLKELGQLKALEQLKNLGQIRILIDDDSMDAKHHGEKNKDKETKKHAKADKDAAEKMKMKEDIKEQIEEQVHHAHAQARRAKMEAVRQQLEARRKAAEKLIEKLNKESEELNKESEEKEGGPSTSTSPSTRARTEGRAVMVQDEPVKPVIRRRVEPRATVAKARAESSGRRLGIPVGERTEVTTAENGTTKAVATLDSSADPMRLAELVSNAVGALEQARSAVDDVHGDSSHRHVAESRVRSAERKVRLLSRIAQSLHAQAAAQAKRTNSQHDQDEIDSKLRILELIQSDVESALGKSATSVTPAVPAAPAAMPVVVSIPTQILTGLTAPAAPVAPVGPVAPASPVGPVAPAPGAVPTPAAVAAPAAVPAPAKPPVKK